MPVSRSIMPATLVLPRRKSSGFTLLEILIAISIFALIGVASFRVLTSVSEAYRRGSEHSEQLTQLQRALTVIDRDLQQFIDRPIRVKGIDSEQQASLIINDNDFALQMTRGGWSNPLQLPRSNLQRIAYDLGPHPDADKPDSFFYASEQQFLLRYIWRQLDRSEEAKPLVQALLPGVDELNISLYTDKGQRLRWPLTSTSSTSTTKEKAKFIQFSLLHRDIGQIDRSYKVEALR